MRSGELLRRQLQDYRGPVGSTLTRSGETAELVSRIEELRCRSEETLRRFQESEAVQGR